VLNATFTQGDIEMQSFYKAVPKRFIEAIKMSGLDPAKAGQGGGATATAIMQGRQPTYFDKNYTWLGGLNQAQSYAKDRFANRDPIILKINLPDSFVRIAVDNCGLAGFGTRVFIPAYYIYFQTAKGDYWAHIATYNGENAYIFEENDSESESDDWL